VTYYKLIITLDVLKYYIIAVFLIFLRMLLVTCTSKSRSSEF